MQTPSSVSVSRCLLLPGTLCMAAMCAPMVQKTWDGECGDTEWQCDDNWEPNGIPGATDDVSLSASDPVIEIGSGDADAQAVNIASGLVVDTTGNVTFHGTSSITNLTAGQSSTSRLFAQGVVSINGNSLSSGVLDGPGMFANDETMTVDGDLRTTLENNGSMTISSADLDVEAGGLLRNNGTLLMGADASIDDTNGDVENNGTIQKFGPGNATIGSHFRMNTGIVDVQEGTLFLSGPIDLTGGAIQVAKGANCFLIGSNSHDRNLGGAFEGAGDFDAGPEVTIAAPLSTNMDGLFTLSSTTTLDADLTNTGVLELEGLTLEGDGSLINEDGGIIETDGAVVFDATLVNHGTFLQSDGINIAVQLNNGPDSEWRVLPGSSFSSFSLAFNSDGFLSFESGGLLNVPMEVSVTGGAIDVVSTEIRMTKGGYWLGGPLTMRGESPEVHVGGTGGLDDLIIEGPYTIENEVGTDGRFIVNGTGVILGIAEFVTLQVESEFAFGTVAGSGVLLIDASAEMKGASFEDLSLINLDHVEITGLTGLGGQFINSMASSGIVELHGGTLRLDGGGHFQNDSLVIMTGPSSIGNTNPNALFTNDGTVECLANSFIECQFNNADGRVLVGDGARLTFSDAENDVLQISNGELTGGVWETEPGSELIFNGVTITAVLGEGTRIVGNNDDMPFMNDLTRNDGNIVLNGGTDFHDTLDFENNGRIEITDSVNTGGEFDNVSGDLLSIVVVGAGQPDPLAIGVVAPALNNGGTIQPGGPDVPAFFGVTGDFTQSIDGALIIELGGLTAGEEHDQLVVTGNCTLDGTLDLSLIEGFELEGSESFVVLRSTTGTVTGTFDAVTGETGFSIEYQTNQVVVTADVTNPCPADITGDEVIDVNDLLALLASWGSDGPGAEIAAPFNVVDVNDLLALLGAWGDC